MECFKCPTVTGNHRLAITFRYSLFRLWTYIQIYVYIYMSIQGRTQPLPYFIILSRISFHVPKKSWRSYLYRPMNLMSLKCYEGKENVWRLLSVLGRAWELLFLFQISAFQRISSLVPCRSARLRSTVHYLFRKICLVKFIVSNISLSCMLKILPAMLHNFHELLVSFSWNIDDVVQTRNGIVSSALHNRM